MQFSYCTIWTTNFLWKAKEEELLEDSSSLLTTAVLFYVFSPVFCGHRDGGIERGTTAGCLHREAVLSTCGPSAGGQNKHHFLDLPCNPLSLKQEWNICCPWSVVSTKGLQTNGKKPQLFPEEKEMWKWSCLKQCIVMPAIPNELHVIKNRGCCVRPCATGGTAQLPVVLWHSRGKMKYEMYIYL